MQPKYLAIDSGGTKCEALLVSASGVVMGRGRCGFLDENSGRGPGGSGRSETNIQRAVAVAIEGMALKGPVVVNGAFPLPFDAEHVAMHEWEGPMADLGAEFGMMALAGTGALVWGRAPDGDALHLDGLGPLLGDHGGAFGTGLAAIRAVGKSDWHPRHATSLAGPIVEACAGFTQTEEGFSLVRYMLEPRDRAEIASLARIVDREAMAGDGVATAILHQAADALASTVGDLVERLGISNAELPLVGAGSVVLRSDVYWSRFCATLNTNCPNLIPQRMRLPACAGIALAMHAARGGDREPFRTNLENSLREP